ncbi:MAG: uracil-DNA glycosylase [Flavobacteriales bacterium]|tara:strand:- start:6140 stop:6838 length:699 start_codon:yes stop_codon:yes gene_type:complete
MNMTTDPIWNEFLIDEFNSDYFHQLNTFLISERKGNEIFPKEENVFNAFNTTPFNKVKVVIIGQDPYHSYEEINGGNLPHAHGLSFSVPTGTNKIPPSLKNIFKELNQDLGFKIPKQGDLRSWAKQGVLLLNATLTVRAHEAGSHQKKGWETFTNNVIEKISLQKEGVIFLLWGKFAQQKETLINTKKHHILKAAHPSPFSAYNGFYGCKHFSETNKLLISNGNNEIDWEIK